MKEKAEEEAPGTVKHTHTVHFACKQPHCLEASTSEEKESRLTLHTWHTRRGRNTENTSCPPGTQTGAAGRPVKNNTMKTSQNLDYTRTFLVQSSSHLRIAAKPVDCTTLCCTAL